MARTSVTIDPIPRKEQRRLTHFFLFLIGCFSLTGCTRPLERPLATSLRSHVPLQTVSLPVPQSALGMVSRSQVTRQPLYKQAEQACRHKEFTQAAALLDTLAHTANLSPSQIAFCRQQQQLCFKDAHPTLPAPPALPAPPRILHAVDADCGPRALLLICQKMNLDASLPALRQAAGTTAKGTTLAGMVRAAKSVGLKAKGVQVDLAALRQMSGPAIAWVDGNHYIAVLRIRRDTVTVHDPNQQREEEMTPMQLMLRCGGILLPLSRA